MTTPSRPANLWAITTYFNPLRTRRRRRNYMAFRAALHVPLLTVELVYGAEPELSGNDAERLICLRGSSFLWQKEALLNVAVSALPANAEVVAWLDCDLAFADPTWPDQALSRLTTHAVVQLFTDFIDLDPSEDHLHSSGEVTGRGFVAHRMLGGPLTKDFPPGSRKRYRPRLPGGAWAAKRSLLERHGFYDSLVLGSGDVGFLFAAYGEFEEAARACMMNQRQARHYDKWASRVYADVAGRVGFLDGTVYHYWHGDIANRRYGQIHEQFGTFDFDPEADVAIDASGCLVWASPKAEMHDYVRRWWSTRLEDGSEDGP